MSQIPVTVLTGYLGAGKTTLLNRILSEPHGQRFAVIVNEFGETGIDGDLVVDADEEIFETNNGCLCCTVRGDLIRIIEGLMKRKGKFDAILVETTGLADPGPVAQTFFVDEDVKRDTKLDAVVTVVDAKHFRMQLTDTPEAQEQVAFADVIVLNKTDLVSETDLKTIEAKIKAINPWCEIHRTERCALPLDTILGRGAFSLDRILVKEPDFLTHGHHHSHDEEMASLSLSSEKPLDQNKFDDWLRKVLAEQGQDILRCKGIIAFKGEPRQFVFQGVHMVLDGDFTQPWKDGEAPISRAVFIGRKLDEEKLRAGFMTCVAG